MEIKSRKLILLGLFFYTILILYFLFFAFNRLDRAIGQYGYTFMLVPEGVPLEFPKLSFGWIYDFGNIAAFIPFGIVIPLLYRVRFGKFISWFILTILAMETLQTLTHLGSFDINDIISNTLGASIGFFAYRVGFSSKVSNKKLIASIMTTAVLLVGVIVLSETINYIAEKREGPIHALHELKEQNGIMPMTGNLHSLTVSRQEIEPKMNVYTSQDGKSKSYTYILKNKKSVKFYSYYGISDKGDSKGEVTILADGIERAQYNLKGPEPLNIPFDEMNIDKINEITIIVSGNAILWDVGFSEMKHWWE